MHDTDFSDETCENCAFLRDDDTCGNADSVYRQRPVVYRDGEEVLQTAWCEHWSGRQTGTGEAGRV